MVENVIKTFKLNYDGSFDEIAYDHIKEVFTIVNILAIYITKVKTMYIWIGRNATQALKNHIPNIRVILKEDFPQFRIIRNITFDMRSEPFEFFNNLNLSKDELYEIINHQEKTIVPILDKVDELKEKSEILIKSEQYKNAIDTLKEIIELAREIQDDALVTEQKRLISTLTEKFENKQIISEIENETTRVEKEYENLIISKKILEAHNLVESFIKKYEPMYDLSLIPSTKELILREKKKWNSEQEKLGNDIMLLEKELNSSLENFDILQATEIFENGLELIHKNITDEKIKNRWEGLKKNIQETKEQVEFIERFEKFSKDFTRLKENHQYNELKSNIEEYNKQLEKIDLPEYRSRLDLLKNETNSAEQSYNEINNEIIELESRIKSERDNNHLNKVIKDCEKVISLANSIGKLELAERYNEILELTIRKIKEIKEFEEKQTHLILELSKFEGTFNESLKAMDIGKMNDILEKGSKFLSEIVDNDVQKKWDDYKTKFNTAKQLLEKILALSKSGMDALNKGSCANSLGFFEQIILQLQEYKS